MKNKRVSIRTKCTLSTLILFTSLFFSTNAAAWGWAWRPLVSIAGGVAINSNLGYSQGFPIANPTTDELYDYSAQQQTQATTIYDGFIGAEWNVYPEWYLQGGFNAYQVSSMSSTGTFLQGADAESADNYSYNFNVLTREYMLESKLLYTLAQIYHPYVLFGMGIAYNNAYGYSTSVPENLTFTRMYQSRLSHSFSYALGLGADIDLSNNLRFGFFYRFADAGKVELGRATIDTTPVSGTLTQTHLYTNQILAQLTFEY